MGGLRRAFIALVVGGSRRARARSRFADASRGDARAPLSVGTVDPPHLVVGGGGGLLSRASTAPAGHRSRDERRHSRARVLPPVAHSWFRALGYCDDRAARAEDDARVLDEVHPADPRALEDDEEEEKEEEEEEEEDEEEDDDAYHVDDHLDDRVDDHRAVRAAEVRACPDRELRDFIQDYADLFTPAAVAFAVSKIARRGLYLARDDHTVWTPDARDADRSDADRFDRFDADRFDRFDADASHRPRVPRPSPGPDARVPTSRIAASVRPRARRRRRSNRAPHGPRENLHHRVGSDADEPRVSDPTARRRGCRRVPRASRGVDVLQRRRRRAPRRRHVRRGLGAGFEPGTKEHFKRVSSRRMHTTANAARVSSASLIRGRDGGVIRGDGRESADGDAFSGIATRGGGDGDVGGTSRRARA